MRVKLYNCTALPDAPLRALLQMACVASHCKGPVVTKVTHGGLRGRSFAVRASYVYKSMLGRRRCTKAGEPKRGVVRTNCGYALVKVRRCVDRIGTDWLAAIQDMWDSAIHEYAHIRDYQKGKRFCQYNRRWKNRPHERRAIHAVQAAERAFAKEDATAKRVQRDNLILELAIAAEQHEKARTARRVCRVCGKAIGEHADVYTESSTGAVVHAACQDKQCASTFKTWREVFAVFCRNRGYGLEVDEVCSELEVRIEAPRGQHFIGDIHEHVELQGNETQQAFWKRLNEEYKGMTCEPCRSECEWWSD